MRCERGTQIKCEQCESQGSLAQLALIAFPFYRQTFAGEKSSLGLNHTLGKINMVGGLQMQGRWQPVDSYWKGEKKETLIAIVSPVWAQHTCKG